MFVTEHRDYSAVFLKGIRNPIKEPPSRIQLLPLFVEWVFTVFTNTDHAVARNLISAQRHRTLD